MSKRKHYVSCLICVLAISLSACNMPLESDAEVSALAVSTTTPGYPTATYVATVDLANLQAAATQIMPSPTSTPVEVTATPAAGSTPDAPPAEEDGRPGEQPADSGAPEGQQDIPDLAAAAAELGVTEEALVAALGEPGQQPDMAAAAAILGVTEEALMEALGGGMMQGGPGGQPPAGGAPGGAPPSN